MPEENNTSDTRNESPMRASAPHAKVRQSSLGIPIAIVIAGLLIALAIFFNGSQKTNTPVGTDNGTGQAEVSVAPVTEEDHILGNPNAPIVIVEYSDFDCPFCKQFHDTMHRIMAEYGEEGSVAWVYRHFPINQLHPNAERLAAASECVAELGGNDAFWSFANLIFNERSQNELTDISQLPDFAERSGVSRSAYNTCVEEGRYTEEIKSDIQAAIEAGARGTPYSVLMAGGQQGIISGARPYNEIKQMIDTVLTQLGE